MGEHLTKDGQFKSDKYDWCPPGFLALKLTDPLAQGLIKMYSLLRADDPEFSTDLQVALSHVATEPRTDGYQVDPDTFKSVSGGIHLLLDSIFGVDCDGDSNVEYKLINREKYQALHYWAVPYPHKEFDNSFKLAMGNLKMAIDEVDRLVWQKEHMADEQ